MPIKKLVMLFVSVLFVSSLFAEEKVLVSNKLRKKKNSKSIVATPTPVPSVTPNPTLEALKKGEPCDSKEELLKKLEEEKKKQKAFSLQGGNTGCSVDKK